MEIDVKWISSIPGALTSSIVDALRHVWDDRRLVKGGHLHDPGLLSMRGNNCGQDFPWVVVTDVERAQTVALQRVACKAIGGGTEVIITIICGRGK